MPVESEPCGRHGAAVPLPLGEYARQLEQQLAEAGRELIRLACAEREAREELNALDAAYKLLDAQAEVHWLARQSAEARLERIRIAAAEHAGITDGECDLLDDILDALDGAGAPEGDGDPDPSVLRDLLLLAGEDIPLERIGKWTPEERAQVADWAGREHLSASDNPVARRPRPSLLGEGQDA
jgi:hypothetical protein